MGCNGNENYKNNPLLFSPCRAAHFNSRLRNKRTVRPWYNSECSVRIVYVCVLCVCALSSVQCAVCTITFMIKMCLMFISFTLLFSGKRYHKCIPRAIVKQQFRRKKKRRKKNGSTRFILGYFFLPFLSSTESS